MGSTPGTTPTGGKSGYGKRLITGISRIDQGLRAVLGGKLRNRPRLRALLWGLIHLASIARIPAMVYVSAQRAAGRRVGRKMRLAGAMT